MADIIAENVVTFRVKDRQGNTRTQGVPLEAAQALAVRLAEEDWAQAAPLTIERVTVNMTRQVETIETVDRPQEPTDER